MLIVRYGLSETIGLAMEFVDEQNTHTEIERERERERKRGTERETERESSLIDGMHANINKYRIDINIHFIELTKNVYSSIVYKHISAYNANLTVWTFRDCRTHHEICGYTERGCPSNYIFSIYMNI